MHTAARVRIPRALSLFALFSVITATAGTAQATPQDLMGFGGRTPGLGMTGASYADNFEAVFANPAGIGGNGRLALSVGFTGGAFQLELDGERFPIDASQGMTIGFQLPLPFGGPLEDVFTFGAGFWTPSNTVLRNDVRFHESPQWSVLERSQIVAIQIGLGINLGRLVNGLRIGVGVSGLAETSGRLDVKLDETNQFVSLTEVQLVTAFAPIAGVQYRDERFALGLTYRAELMSTVALDITVSNLPIELPILTLNAIAHFDPHTLVIEGAWFPTESLMLVAHLTYRRWSVYPGPTSKTTELSNFPPDPGFRDTISPRVAIEWTTSHGPVTASLRGGFAFEQTPTPPAQMRAFRDSEQEPLTDSTGAVVMTPTRYLDSNRYVLTAGLGLVWQTPRQPRIVFDLFGQLHRVARRTHRIPSPTGTRNMRTQGLVLALGWTGGIEW